MRKLTNSIFCEMDLCPIFRTDEASLMSLVGFLSFIVDLYSFLSVALVQIFSSLFSTGKFVYGFGSHGLNGITAALDYIPTCTGNGLTCGFEAFCIFFGHLGKSIDVLKLHTQLWNIVVCLIVICSPNLRQIVLTCLSFIITFCLAILVKVLGVARNRNVRNARMHWSLRLLKRAFKHFKGRLSTDTDPRPHTSMPLTSRNTSEAADSNLACIVCFEKPKCVVFIPCRHACLCVECTKALLQRQRLCPLCRKRIANTMQIYI